MPAPRPEPAPDRVDAPIDLWNPGGDAGVLRRAAGAWREMASLLRSLTEAIGAEAHAVRDAWSGAAADAFDAHWRRMEAAMADGAGHFEEIATHLDHVAAQIDDTNHQVHELYEAIGITVAVGAIGAVVTFGFSSAGAAAVAAGEASRAATLVARLEAVLQLTARAMSGFRAALAVFARRWALAAAANTVATVVQKSISNPGHNPLERWTVADVTQIVVSSTAGAGAATAAGVRFEAVAAARPVAASAGIGAAGSVVGSLAGDLWVRHQPFSPATVRNAALRGAAGAVGGAGTTAVLRRFGGPPPMAGPLPGEAPTPTLLQRIPAGAPQEGAVGVPLKGVVKGVVPGRAPATSVSPGLPEHGIEADFPPVPRP
jgi:WXG100 family type VII secretion target